MLAVEAFVNSTPCKQGDSYTMTKIGLKKFSVRARAPLRLGIAGGGTDLSPYCDQFGGAVLNVTIDRFAFAHLTYDNANRVTFRARDLGKEEIYEQGEPFKLDDGLILHKAVYRHFVDTYLDGVGVPMTVSTTIDAPAGSGLGSSSALVVALVEGFRNVLDLPLLPNEVARLAYDIERVKLQLAGGRQDQYAAAFGGVNFIEFHANELVIVNPLRVKNDYLKEFESSLVICFTGQSRRSETIILEQVSGLKTMNPETVENMHCLKKDAVAMKNALLQGDIMEMATILRHSWEAKKKTATNIATAEVDRLVELALEEGAWGGKVSGAGGGGFLMFCTDPENRYHLITALNKAGGQASAVKLTMDGVEAWTTRV
jgi:D-glycero-alpha-D-manno-heptose-7-phosphate kinase